MNALAVPWLFLCVVGIWAWYRVIESDERIRKTHAETVARLQRLTDSERAKHAEQMVRDIWKQTKGGA